MGMRRKRGWRIERRGDTGIRWATQVQIGRYTANLVVEVVGVDVGEGGAGVACDVA